MKCVNKKAVPGTANPPVGLSGPQSATRNPQSAFVLILVLVLLALVTILVTVTTIMSRVERRGSWNAARIELARQNALFALNTALAQLQRAAGPDQRVTARADILSSGTNNGQPAIVQPYWTGVWQTYNSTAAASGSGFQYLDGQTGGIAGTVMGTGTTGYNIRQWSTSGLSNPSGSAPPLATCSNMVWLVSGGTNNSTINPSVSLSSANSVVLAKNLNAASAYSGSTGALSVSVPLVPVMGTTAGGTTNASGTSGKYGYWVSDEGVKARVNLSDPTYGISPSSNFVQNQQHFLTPQANPIQPALLLGGSNTQDLRSTSVVAASDFNKVTTLQSMGLIGSGNALVGMSGTGAAFFSPDVTTYSRGVLADVRNGGLKIDLSQAFEDPSQLSAFLNSFTNTSSPMLRLWQPVQPSWNSGDASVWSIITPSFDFYNDMTPAEFGPRWQSLYNYYCMYKNAIPYSVQKTSAAPWSNINAYSVNTPGTTSPTVDQRVFDYTSNYNGSNGSSSNEMGEYYLPHVLGYAVSFSMQAVPGAAAGSGTSYKLIVYAVPQLVLYNPYNVVLQAHGGTPYTVNLYSNILGQTWSIQVVGAAADAQMVESKKPISWGGASVNGTATGGGELTFVTGTGNYVFQPGEIKVVGAQTQADKQAASGKLVVFDGQGGDQLIGGTPGYSQYQYVYADSSTNGTLLWTGTLTSPASDQIVVSATFGGTEPNDGEYMLASNPASWPGTATVNTPLGRFFNKSPGTTSGASISMNVTAISSTQVPNRSVANQFCEFVLRAKGMQQVNSSTSSLTYSYGAPVFAGCDGALSPLPVYFDDTMQDIYFGLNQNSVSTTEIQGGSAPPYDSYWGSQDVGLNPADPSFLVLHDLPRQPMISLGQFMHMAMRNSKYATPQNEIDTNSSLWPVGGSLADPFFALNLTNNNSNTPANGVPPFPTTPTQGGGSAAYFDDNFLMNQALFDSYYFSTLPPSASGAANDSSYANVMPSIYTSGSTQCTNANIQNGTAVLPNARMSFYWKNGVPPQTTGSGSANYLMNYQKSSANLLMNGAFNVNSTSVQAWASLLSSLSGNAVNYLSSTGTFSTLTSGALQNPIFRLLSPVLSHSATVSPSEINTSGTASPWGCVNALSNSQVLALATSIVNQVKQRGPFLSMADFLNRRLDPPYFSVNTTTGSTTGFGLKGALQAAIDNTLALTGTDLNNTQLDSYGMASGANIVGSRGSPPTTGSNTLASGTTILQAEVPNTAEGAPGWLMQQDLVQCFSPVMTVRSDTFVVRCYGEADNQVTGNTEGRAWCEAVVQRVPDYVDQTDTALTSGNAYTTSSLGDATPPYDRVTPVASAGNDSTATPAPIVDTANQVFGRRFKVISFRWLNESDL